MPVAAAPILRNIGTALAITAQLKSEEIASRMFDFRIRDALQNRTLPSDRAQDLRLAFEAAWQVGEYATAYGLLDDLELFL